jgi:hypothetical protein
MRLIGDLICRPGGASQIEIMCDIKYKNYIFNDYRSKIINLLGSSIGPTVLTELIDILVCNGLVISRSQGLDAPRLWLFTHAHSNIYPYNIGVACKLLSDGNNFSINVGPIDYSIIAGIKTDALIGKGIALGNCLKSFYYCDDLHNLDLIELRSSLTRHLIYDNFLEYIKLSTKNESIRQNLNNRMHMLQSYLFRINLFFSGAQPQDYDSALWAPDITSFRGISKLYCDNHSNICPVYGRKGRLRTKLNPTISHLYEDDILCCDDCNANLGRYLDYLNGVRDDNNCNIVDYLMSSLTIN